MPKVTMPQLGESVAEGTIGKWLKNVGDPVAKYEPIVEVITDKVNAEVPSPYEGTLTEILVQEGETVPNDTEIAVIQAAGEGATADQATASPRGGADAEAPGAIAGAEAVADEGPVEEAIGAQAGDGSTQDAPTPGAADASPADGQGAGAATDPVGGGYGPAGSDERTAQEQRGAAAAATAEPEGAPTERSSPSGQPSAPGRAAGNGAGTGTTHDGGAALDAYGGRMTPAVRRLAREHGIDLAMVQGTGHAGRVTREDVQRFIQSGGAQAGQAGSAAVEARPPAGDGAQAQVMGTAPQPQAQPQPAPTEPVAAPQPSQPAQPAAPQAAVPAPASEDRLKPANPMRRAIANAMTRSLQVPVAYTVIEVDMSGVVALRDGLKRDYQDREGISLSYDAIVAKATVEALRRHPDFNAHYTEEGHWLRRAINLGVAVAVEDGLVVPVIHDADRLSVNGLNHRIRELAEKARGNRLRLDDIQGGTFTLDNTGWTGSIITQPIINTPEVGILTMESIVKRPVVVETPHGDSLAVRPMMYMCLGFDHRATDGAQAGRFMGDVKRWLESVDADLPVW